MLSNHLTLCHPLFLLASIFPSTSVFSKESALHWYIHSIRHALFCNSGWKIISKVEIPLEFRRFFHKMVLLFIYVCMCTQSCPTLFDTLDYSPPGSSVHGTSQARILEQIAISYSRGSSQSRDRTCISCFGRQILYQLSHQGSPGIYLQVHKSVYNYVCFIH